MDIFFAIILTPFTIPIIAVFGLLIKLEDKGSIFYLGERRGKDKKIFKMYKLRSMKINAPDIRNSDGSTFNSDADPRLLKIGQFIRKTSIDELPQIINVLLGDMSFIGPRPELQDHIEYYDKDETDFLDILPGITGYNQAYFRNSVNRKEKLKNDLFYVKNISFVLDCKIFIKTFLTVFFRKGIYRKSN